MVELKEPFNYFRSFLKLPKDIKLILFSNLFSSIQYGLFAVIQTLYLKSLGYNPPTIGLLVGLTPMLSMFFLIPSGVIANRFGKKWLLVVSGLAYLSSFMIYATLDAFHFLLLASLLGGLSWGVYVAPFQAIIADNVETAKRSYAYSLSSFLFSFGLIIGSLVAGLKEILESTFHLPPIFSYRLMFWFLVAIGIASVVPLIPIKEESRVDAKAKSYFTIKSWRSIGKLTLFQGLIGLGSGFFVVLLPLYLNMKFSALEVEIGVLLAVSNAVTGISYLAAPKLIEMMGSVRSIVLSQSIAVLLLVLIPLSPSFEVAALLYSARTMLMNFASPIISTYTTELVERNEVALTSGVTATAWNGANAVSTMVAGQIMGTNLDLPPYLCGLTYALSIMLFYFFFKGD
ncbi:MAG: MFS transporter [Candidatus Bathyarchaeota archaeon]|nr:MFS transporter [Candidatus Bathyarchaeota archaeon]